MIAAIIPSRFASTRFPGKPLADINGKTMIRRVYEQVKKARKLDRVVVATDDERIGSEVESFGGEFVMTAASHPSGTDRCYEASRKLGMSYEYIINVQGDEPFIDPQQVDQLATELTGDTSIEIGTLVKKISDGSVLNDPNAVKVVLNAKHEALYFSRQAIPYLRDPGNNDWSARHVYFQHIGMYAYRSDILERITNLPVSSLEKAESLEQLRWLENGYRIRCVETNIDTWCIDTPADIEKVLRNIAGN